MMDLVETKYVQVQYNKTKTSKEGSNTENCRIPLTKSIIEEMGAFKGCTAKVDYNLTENKIIISFED